MFNPIEKLNKTFQGVKNKVMSKDEEEKDMEKEKDEKRDIKGRLLFKGKKAYLNEKWLRGKRIDEDLTQTEIAEECNVSLSTIGRACKDYGLRDKDIKDELEETENEELGETDESEKTDEDKEAEESEGTEKLDEDEKDEESEQKEPEEGEEEQEGFDIDTNWIAYGTLGLLALGAFAMFSKQKNKTEQVQDLAKEKIDELQQEREMWQEKVKEQQESQPESSGRAEPGDLDTY